MVAPASPALPAGDARPAMQVGSFEFQIAFCEHTPESKAREETVTSWLLLEWMRHVGEKPLPDSTSTTEGQ